jgi:hypothetical protein
MGEAGSLFSEFPEKKVFSRRFISFARRHPGEEAEQSVVGESREG